MRSPLPQKGDRIQALSMLYAENIAFMRTDCPMRQFLEPLSLEISPDSLSQGEPAIRQAIAFFG
jgi:hypothetical protein